MFIKSSYNKKSDYLSFWHKEIGILKAQERDYDNYLVIDIETFKLKSSDNQIAYSVAIKGSEVFKLLQLHTYDNYKNTPIESSHIMINDIIDYIISLKLPDRCKHFVIFAHNLGSFDGYFILESLIKRVGVSVDDIKLIMDDSNSIVELKFDKLIFRDSYRIFPTSLAKLATICNLQFEKLPFTHNVELKDLDNSIFQDESYNYLRNDVDLLFGIIEHFKAHLMETYQIRLRDLYSTSNMAFKVFRTKFLKKEIHSSTQQEYNLIKKTYYGGAVQIYQNYGENLYYYDVNSLYPYVMLKPLPIKYMSTLNNLTESDLIKHDYFGFAVCEIIISDNEVKPQVPVRNGGKIIYPVGKIYGTYFSEEIKSWLTLGYKVKLFTFYNFTKVEGIFEDYINYFYAKKSDIKEINSRFLNKLLLNGLYGYFGRKLDYDSLKFIKASDTYIYNNIDLIDEWDVSPDYKLVRYEDKHPDKEEDIWDMLNKSNLRGNLMNIGISSAIASYARIHMHKFKTIKDNNVIYSDTDSVILEKPLKNVTSLLGDMKLEYIIKEGLFIRPKLYGLITDKGEKIVKAAGYPQNSVEYKDIKKSYKDKDYVKHIKTTRFYKIINGLKIDIKETSLQFKSTHPIKVIKHRINMKHLNDKDPDLIEL